MENKIEDKETITMLILMKVMRQFKLTLTDILIYRLAFKLQKEIGYDDFHRTDFGPFSEELYNKLLYLLKENYIKVKRAKNGCSYFILTKKAIDLLVKNEDNFKFQEKKLIFEDFLDKLKSFSRNATKFYKLVLSDEWPIVIK